ncbi:hypothetical protein A3860_09045 [Niastella vici]|uniref:Uncharacterized protein n=1 Tax=Niastella vici TaxID=1703345 RepID=A0A1V9FHC8_9BACT|nr:hypothetical protein [Niastella vici]OQP57762.1 hypothetical protein A3860_09045 [Niastella vici]
MKKLKLKALELGAKEVLSRDQLKNVFGGSVLDDGGSGQCSTLCVVGSSYKVCNTKVVSGYTQCVCPDGSNSSCH